jgi:hypothetical protein
MGQPVLMTNCTDCNENGDAEVGEGVAEYADRVEYIMTRQPKGEDNE